jgi:superfamily II DNA or RNA helicase
MAQSNGARRELTLKDRLSRLDYVQACKLLGSEGGQLIRKGGGLYEVDIEEAVYLRGDLFRLTLPDGAVVTITLMSSTPRRLKYNCTHCDEPCEHVGAAFALILEEKLALGLAAAPVERTPVESLGEAELVRRAVEERKERADQERMKIKSMDPDHLWTDYLVTNRESGKTYRVALRGWEPGESYCSCPDFRVNTLGVCKHVFKVHQYAERQFSANVRGKRFHQRDLAIHLYYGPETELRLLCPDQLDPAAARVVKPILNTAITDVPDLVGRLRKLAAMGRDVTVYPDAETHINRQLFAIRVADKMAEIRKSPRRHPLRRELLKTELLPYQLDGIAFAVGAGRSILADDMGLGKTIQAIGVAELLAREADISRVLVICPASVTSQWRGEIKRFSGRDCQIVIGNAEDRVSQYANGAFFTICNYEQVLRDILAVEKTPWDLIVLDEGQRIKNWEAMTSRVIKGLKSPFALVLSGTPLENRLEDLYSVAQFIDDRRLGPAFRFLNRHRVTDEKGKVLGYRNLAELRERLTPILLRRTRASVMQELPPRSTEIVRIAPTDEQLRLHAEYKRTIVHIVSKKFISEMDLLRLRKALLMCRMAADGTALIDKEKPGWSSKLERLDGLLGDLLAETDRKIILFSEWTTMLDMIEPLLNKHGVQFVRLDGSVPQKKRQQLVHAFQHDPACRLIIMTNAGSTGLNLQAANTVINVDLPWNPAILEQRIGRAHRMGQKRHVQVYLLVTEQTIEEELLKTLSAKHDLAMAALDIESDVDRVDLQSGIEELKQRLEVLLGQKPIAPVDESEKAAQTAEAQRLAQQERVATAGGQLLGAAFTFLDAMLPPDQAGNPASELTQAIKARLSECVQPDEQGRPKLSLVLPDASFLDRMADTIGRLLNPAKA